MVIPAGSALISEISGPVNNIIDPGETVTLSFAFRNIAGSNITNLVATLLTNNAVTLPSGPQTNYGVLIVGGPSVSLQFTFTAIGTNGQTIAATFQLQSGTNNLERRPSAPREKSSRAPALCSRPSCQRAAGVDTHQKARAQKASCSQKRQPKKNRKTHELVAQLPGAQA